MVFGELKSILPVENFCSSNKSILIAVKHQWFVTTITTSWGKLDHPNMSGHRQIDNIGLSNFHNNVISHHHTAAIFIVDTE